MYEILRVNLTTNGDYKTGIPIPFKPNVAVFFTTKIFLDKKVLLGNGIEIIPSLFLNSEVFDRAEKIILTLLQANPAPPFE